MEEYFMFNEINDDSKLADLFNACMGESHGIRIISSPDYITPDRFFEDESAKESAIMFYFSVVYENHFHALVRQLNKKRTEIKRFENEFNSDFDKYAIENRLYLIETDGGDNDDTKRDATGNGIYDYSIVQELKRELNIFTDSKPDHFATICSYLENITEFSVKKFCKKQGIPFSSGGYQDGEFVKFTIEEEIENEARTAYACDSYSDLLKLAIHHINVLGGLIQELPNDETSIPRIIEIESYIDDILEMKIK